MSCSCGDSCCNCLEKCLCPPEFCTCMICFNLSNVPDVKHVKKNVAFESIPSTSRSSGIVDFTNTDYRSDVKEVINTSSLYEEMEDDVIFIEPSTIKQESENCYSSNLLFPKINLSDNECEIVFQKQGNPGVSESSAKEKIDFSGMKTTKAKQTSTRRKKVSRSLSDSDSDYKCRSWKKRNRSERKIYRGFPKKTHITRFLEQQYGWKKHYKNIDNRVIQENEDAYSKIKPRDAKLQTSSRRIKGSHYSSYSKRKRSRNNHTSDLNSYHGLPRKIHISQWRQWTFPSSGNSQVSTGTLIRDQASHQQSCASIGHYPSLKVTIALKAVSVNRAIKVNKDYKHFTECNHKKRENNSLEIKSDNANQKTSTRRRKGFRYSSNNDSNSKRTRIGNKRGRNRYHALPSKTHITQFQKPPHAATAEYNKIKIVVASDDTQVNKNIIDYSNFKRYFIQSSSNNIEHDVNNNETSEKSTVSKLSYSSFRRKSSNVQTSKYGLFSQESHFYQKKGKASRNNPRSARNDNEALSKKIEEGPPSFFGQQIDLTSSIVSEMPKKKNDATKSSTILRHRQKKIQNLKIYDFDENETTRNLPGRSKFSYLNSSKCCVNNLVERETNVCSTDNQCRYSDAYTVQNTDKDVSDCEVTRKKPRVTFLNPSYPSSSDICDDYEKNYYDSSKRKRKRKRKILKGTAGMYKTPLMNELVSDMMYAGKSCLRARKYGIKIPSKQRRTAAMNETPAINDLVTGTLSTGQACPRGRKYRRKIPSKQKGTTGMNETSAINDMVCDTLSTRKPCLRGRKYRRKILSNLKKTAGMNETPAINELASDTLSTGKPCPKGRKYRRKIPSKQKGTSGMNETSAINELVSDTLSTRKPCLRERKYRRRIPSKQKGTAGMNEPRRFNEFVSDTMPTGKPFRRGWKCKRMTLSKQKDDGIERKVRKKKVSIKTKIKKEK